MVRVFRAFAFALTAFAAIPQPTRAQEEDIYFVGNALSQLRSAVYTEYISIKNLALKRDLRGIPGDPPPIELAVLLVPKNSTAVKPQVWKAYNDGSTGLVALNVDPDDILSLRRFPRDGIVAAFRNPQGGGPLTDAEAKAVLALIGNQPVGEQTRARNFAGAVLADLGVAGPNSATLVKSFRYSSTQKLRELLDGQSPNLEPGVPYVFGSRPLTERHLAATPADKVLDIRVGDENLKMTWIGSSGVLVKPMPGANVKNKQNAVDSLYLSPELRDRLKDGNELPPTNLKSLPFKKR